VPFKLTPKPPEEVILPAKAEHHLTPFERAIQRSDIKIDLAACIRWFWFGLAAFVTAMTGLVMALSSAPKAEAQNGAKPSVEAGTSAYASEFSQHSDSTSEL
jgi:hypothetical protein